MKTYCGPHTTEACGGNQSQKKLKKCSLRKILSASAAVFLGIALITAGILSSPCGVESLRFYLKESKCWFTNTNPNMRSIQEDDDGKPLLSNCDTVWSHQHSGKTGCVEPDGAGGTMDTSSPPIPAVSNKKIISTENETGKNFENLNRLNNKSRSNGNPAKGSRSINDRVDELIKGKP